MNRDEKLQWFYDRIIELRDELFYFAYSILRSVPESEDAVSSAIIKAHTHIDSLRNRNAFKPWLFRIVRNECYATAKLRKRTVPIADEMPYQYQHEHGTEYRVDVENALARLPQEQREAVTLYYVCNHSVNEIAKILEVPSGTVKSRLSRARAELKRLLGDEYYEI